MTVQIAAASTALVLGEEKRINGQWKRNTVGHNCGLTGAAEKESLRRCGFVLDVLGRDAVRDVRDGTSLNSVYERAVATREAERMAHQGQQNGHRA